VHAELGETIGTLLDQTEAINKEYPRSGLSDARDEIKDIRPVMTIVGGRIVYDPR
jgi:predicted amidohydrolase YtcJ